MATGLSGDLLKTTTNSVDLSYLEYYGNRKKYQIPTCFTKYHFKQGDIFETRISYIYDLSKFWIVPRFKELEIYQKYLYRLYETKKQFYKIPHNNIEIDLYCVAYTCGNYYRGIIVDICVTIEANDKVKIFFYDYGMIELINIDDLYYMDSKCFSVPQFAIRASLAGICPKNSYTWTDEHFQKFLDLVRNRILIAQVSNVNVKHQIIDLFIKLHYSENCTIQDKLVEMKCAQYFNIDIIINNNNNNGPQQKCKQFQDNRAVKYLYLYPSHEVLESGRVPFDIQHVQSIYDILLITGPSKQYFKDIDGDEKEN